PRSPDQHVVGVGADQRVIAPVSDEQVVAVAAADHGVVAGAAGDEWVFADQDVVLAFGSRSLAVEDDRLPPHRVIDLPDVGPKVIEVGPVGGVGGDDAVVPRTGVDDVGSPPRVDRVFAAGGPDRVVAVAADHVHRDRRVVLAAGA